MKILYFSVNSKHKKFFEKVNALGCDGKIISSKKLLLPSFKASFTFPDYLNEATTLRVKDFTAKYGYKNLTFFIKGIYSVIAYWNYLRYFRAISKEYTHMMVWNSSLFRQSIAINIAKQYHIQPIVVEAGLLPNRIVIDTKGANYLNSVPRKKSFFENYTNHKKLPDSLIPRVPKNAKKFLNTTKITLPEKYIFVPFQVDYDTQILLFSPWIKDMDMLFSIIEKISKTLHLHFVFKEHPSSIKEYPQLHQKVLNNPYLSFANGYATQELIERSQVVITVNSTVGIESLLFHKRVIVLGKAFYAIEEITKQAITQESLETILHTLESWEPNIELIDNFLKYLYDEYLIEGDFTHFNKEQLKQRIGCKG